MIDAFLKNFFQCYAHSKEEIPSFTQIYSGNTLLSQEYNFTRESKNQVLHSEVLAIQNLNREKIYNKNTTLLTTLEPCLMCAGAIMKARIENVIYFAETKPNEGISSIPMEIFYSQNFVPKILFIKNLEIEKLFSSFFLNKR